MPHLNEFVALVSTSRSVDVDAPASVYLRQT